MAGRGFNCRTLRRTDRFLQEKRRRQQDGESDGRRICGIPGQERSLLGYPSGRRRQGWAYRNDWFEDPKEKTAFKAKYGYELDVPETWAQLRDIAEFFIGRKKKRYGVTIYTDNSYDALVMGVMNTIFGYGGEMGDYSTNQVQGITNSKESIEGLSFTRNSTLFVPRLEQDVLPGSQPGVLEWIGRDEHELFCFLSSPCQ